MEYVQERIATLHDLAGRTPAAPVDETAVVVPMTEREYGSLATERVLSKLEDVAPARVVVALRTPSDHVTAYRRWLSEFDLPLSVLWCTGGGLGELLSARGLDGAAGKGRDVWLGLGVATADHPYVAVHDADTRTYSTRDVPRLVSPLARGFSFAKGYYARVESNRLYGRLFRLLYAPLVRALQDRHAAPVLSYLASFRYALAGEFAATADLARRLRIERRFGLEVGILRDAFDRAGFDGTAQVDLGRYEHDHRAVSGPAGLEGMSEDVAAALLRTVEEHGVVPDYERLPDDYREAARRLVSQYEADAAFNRLTYDREDELSQVDTYADAVVPPGDDTCLPAWTDVDLDVDEVLSASREDIDAAGRTVGR